MEGTEPAAGASQRWKPLGPCLCLSAICVHCLPAAACCQSVQLWPGQTLDALSMSLGPEASFPEGFAPRLLLPRPTPSLASSRAREYSDCFLWLQLPLNTHSWTVPEGNTLGSVAPGLAWCLSCQLGSRKDAVPASGLPLTGEGRVCSLQWVRQAESSQLLFCCSYFRLSTSPWSLWPSS